MIDFRIDFLPKLAPFWDPSWNPRAAQDGPKTPPQTFQDATKTAQEPQEHPRSKFGPFLVPKSDGVPPRASIFEVCSTFKFKFWCQICVRELGKFYCTLSIICSTPWQLFPAAAFARVSQARAKHLVEIIRDCKAGFKKLTAPQTTQCQLKLRSIFHPPDVLIQTSINFQSTWGPNKLARRYKGEAFYNKLFIKW